MDFNEINRLNIDKTSIGNKEQKKPKKIIPEIKKQESEETSPANPSYWQNAFGINKQTSFKGINFQNIHIFSDEAVDETFLNEKINDLKYKVNFNNEKEINDCIEFAKTLSQHGKRALNNYINTVSVAFNNNYPDNRIIEMTNLIFEKVPKFSVDCVEPLQKFLKNINCTDKEGYDLVKDCINAVLSDNSDDNSKMAWIAFHMPLKYKPYKEILIKKRDNYNKIFTNIKKINELVEEKQKLIADLMPSRENNDKIIEEKRKQITLKNADKNKIKEKRKDEDKLLKIAEKEKDEKVNKLGGILHPSKELIRKIAANIAKFNEKDIVDCKNTWENFQFGR